MNMYVNAVECIACCVPYRIKNIQCLTLQKKLRLLHQMRKHLNEFWMKNFYILFAKSFDRLVNVSTVFGFLLSLNNINCTRRDLKIEIPRRRVFWLRCLLTQISIARTKKSKLFSMLRHWNNKSTTNEKWNSIFFWLLFYLGG